MGSPELASRSNKRSDRSTASVAGPSSTSLGFPAGLRSVVTFGMFHLVKHRFNKLNEASSCLSNVRISHDQLAYREGRRAKSQAVADLPVGVRHWLLHHRVRRCQEPSRTGALRSEDYVAARHLSGARMTVHGLDPWMPVESGEARSAFEAELYRELGAGHSLSGLPVVAIARRADQDDVLFMLGDGRVAEVHLTWLGRPEDVPRWPGTSIHASIEAWIEQRMMPDHEEFRGAD